MFQKMKLSLLPTVVRRRAAVIFAALSVVLLSSLAACGGPAPATAPAPTPTQTPSAATTPGPGTGPTPAPVPSPRPSGPIKAEWIEAQVDGETAAVPLNEVESKWNIHFRVKSERGDTTFMAYKEGGVIYVRANVCPPCRSIGYYLDKGILVCERCATTFEAKSGNGIKGACVDYPKAPVPYKLSDGKITMALGDLATAYQNTLKPGWP